MSSKFISWLSEKIVEKGWSMRELSRRAKISSTSVANVMSGERLPTWDFCAAISVPLGEPVWNVFRLAGLLPGGIDESELTYQKLLDIMQKMPSEQRAEVLKYAYYLLQRGENHE